MRIFSGRRRKKGQQTLEYVVIFVAMALVVIYASKSIMRPAVNSIFNGVGNLLENAAAYMERTATPDRITFGDPSLADGW